MNASELSPACVFSMRDNAAQMQLHDTFVSHSCSTYRHQHARSKADTPVCQQHPPAAPCSGTSIRHAALRKNPAIFEVRTTIASPPGEMYAWYNLCIVLQKFDRLFFKSFGLCKYHGCWVASMARKILESGYLRCFCQLATNSFCKALSASKFSCAHFFHVRQCHTNAAT